MTARPPTLCFALLVAACDTGGSGSVVLEQKPAPSEVVDNLILLKPVSGNGLAPLGGAVGRFSLEGRCLVLTTGGDRHTPAFTGRAAVLRHVLRVGGRDIPYDTDVRLPMISGPVEIAALQGTACPARGRIVRSVE